MKYITGAKTDIGSMRENNQDAVCIMEAKTTRGKLAMVIVCDGMGGLSKGEVASSTVVKAFEKWFESEALQEMKGCGIEGLKQSWIRTLFAQSEILKEYGRKKHILLGTTFTGMLFWGKEYFWVHVGDSRIYHIRRSHVTQLTTDHVVGTKDPRLQNQLTQCIGASKVFLPETGMGHMEKNDCFLICSDGFYRKLALEEMVLLHRPAYHNEKSLNRFCKNHIEKLIHRGEKDNLSAAILKGI